VIGGCKSEGESGSEELNCREDRYTEIQFH
jgi:hypothetical protein